MPFIILIGIVIAVLLLCAVFSCVKFGLAETRRKFRSLSSRMMIVLSTLGVLMLSAVYCYDFLTLLLNDALSTGAVDEFGETARLFFGTTSIFSSVKTLFVSCVMLGFLSCIIFRLVSIDICPGTINFKMRNCLCGISRTACQDGMGTEKSFLTYARFIS